MKKQETKVEETFLDRLRKEKDELQDKYDKLDTFLNKDDASIKVGYTQYNLLINQKIVMEKYLEILDKRIEDLDSKEKKADERIQNYSQTSDTDNRSVSYTHLDVYKRQVKHLRYTHTELIGIDEDDIKEDYNRIKGEVFFRTLKLIRI